MTKFEIDYNSDKWQKMYGNRNEPWNGIEPIVECLLFLTEAKSVLDIACLRGDFLFFFEKHIKSLGLDLSDWGIKNKFCNSDIIKANCKELPFKENQFDLVTMFDIVEHLTPNELKISLQEAKRVAKKSIVVLPASLLASENEFISNDPSNDLAGHLIFWKNDKWLHTIAEELVPKFVFDPEATMRFVTILNRLKSYPEQWRSFFVFSNAKKI